MIVVLVSLAVESYKPCGPHKNLTFTVETVPESTQNLTQTRVVNFGRLEFEKFPFYRSFTRLASLAYRHR